MPSIESQRSVVASRLDPPVGEAAADELLLPLPHVGVCCIRFRYSLIDNFLLGAGGVSGAAFKFGFSRGSADAVRMSVRLGVGVVTLATGVPGAETLSTTVAPKVILEIFGVALRVKNPVWAEGVVGASVFGRSTLDSNKDAVNELVGAISGND